MLRKSRAERPNRRSHDLADRQARTRRLTIAATAVVVLGTVLGGYWWYRRTDPPRDGAPGWLPDGRAIVFAAEIEPARADIFRMDADGTGRRPLLQSPWNDSAPAASPDGQWIAFESNRDGNDEIYVVDASGRNVLRLTDHPARDRAPAWSPDGRRIAFTSNRDHQAGADVYVMYADGTGVERITTGLTTWGPQFSPDGRRIAVQIERDVHVIDLDSRQYRRLTWDPQNGMAPTWSPDGSQIAFVTTRNGRAEIFTMNADGSHQQRLVTMAGGSAIDPRWSPDGSRVAFVLIPYSDSDPDAGVSPGGSRAIYTIEVGSGIVTRLSR